MELIPAIDLKDGHCVRLKQGRMDDDTVFSEDPVAVADHWVKQGARRLHLVDLNGAFAGEPVNGEIVNAISVAGILAAQVMPDVASLRPVDAPWTDRPSAFSTRMGHR